MHKIDFEARFLYKLRHDGPVCGVRWRAAACGGGQTGDLTIISAGADLADTAFYLSHTRRSHFTAKVN